MPVKALTPQGGLNPSPYPKAKDVLPVYTECELCKRPIPTKCWAEHARSKKHRKFEDEERRSKDQVKQQQGNSTGYNGNDNSNSAGAPSFDGECRNCHQHGHRQSDCHQSGASGGCFNCGEHGHRKADCTNPPRTGGGGDNRPCHNCGQPGHRKVDCTNERVMKCNNCEDYGHGWRDCTAPKDWSKVQCRNCKAYGHTVKRCQAPPAEGSGGDNGGWGDAAPDAGASGDWANGSGGDETPATGGWENGTEATGDWSNTDATNNGVDNNAW